MSGQYWMQWNGADFRRDTAELSTDAELCYRRLLEFMFERGGKLRNDPKSLAALGRVRGSNWARVWSEISHYFTVTDDGHLTQARIADAVSEIESRSAARSRIALEREARKANINKAAEAQDCQSCDITNNQEPYIRDGIGNAQAREPLADLEVKLREAAGWQSEPAPMLAVTGPVQAIIDAGADIDLDVLPTVRALAASARSRTSWKYFLNAIAQARDDRIGAAKIVSIPTREDRHGPNRKAPSRADTFAKLYAVCDEAERREIEARNGDNRTDVQGAS